MVPEPGLHTGAADCKAHQGLSRTNHKRGRCWAGRSETQEIPRLEASVWATPSNAVCVLWTFRGRASIQRAGTSEDPLRCKGNRLREATGIACSYLGLCLRPPDFSVTLGVSLLLSSQPKTSSGESGSWIGGKLQSQKVETAKRKL